MSDTPRTDLKAEATTDFRGINEVVPANFARQLERELNEAGKQLDHLLQHCKDYECETCSKIICPHQDPMHFHHDGCPSCVGFERLREKLKEANRQAELYNKDTQYVMAQRDQWRKCAEELADALLEAKKTLQLLIRVDTDPLAEPGSPADTIKKALAHFNELKGKQ